jgi:hypothetical protein
MPLDKERSAQVWVAFSQRWSAGDTSGKVIVQPDGAAAKLVHAERSRLVHGPLAHQAEHLPFKPLPTRELL